MFSYAKVPGGGYQAAAPRRQGLGFGGTPGKERLWLDDDFARVTAQHHAVDKTFGPGPLADGQGYAPAEGAVEGVEAWGLGGADAATEQRAYKQREETFSEQRRKVDLKKFAGNWEESPDKAMMEMMGDPGRPAREER